MAFCTNCGQELKADFVFCPECGEKVIDDLDNTAEGFSLNSNQSYRTRICKYCGAELQNDSFYCLSCGRAVDDDKIISNITDRCPTKYANRKWRNKWVSLLLCFFFGGLGIHRFYEGKIITGILYLFSFGFFGVGWFIDIVRILLKPNPYQVK